MSKDRKRQNKFFHRLEVLCMAIKTHHIKWCLNILLRLFKRQYKAFKDKWKQITSHFYGSWLICGAIILAILIYTAIHEDINWWIDIHCDFLIDFFTMVCSHWQTNLFLTALCFCLCVRIIISSFVDNLISSYRFICSLGLIFWLCISDDREYYDTIIPHFTYWLFFLIFALAILGIEGVKAGVWVYKALNNKEKKNNLSKCIGFTSDNIDVKSTDSRHRNELVKLVSKRLLNTNLDSESYAAGIVGSWGSGKTTFLHLMQKEFKGKAYIINFLPWNCSSPSQIISDFLSQVKENLAPCLGSLGHTISEYAEQLSDLDDSIGSKITNKVLHNLNDSLSVTKDRLSSEIAKLEKPVIVFIDDLDRLEVNEIFEVLKLVRNTASFKNTIYIVAYDKSYIIKTMTDHKFTGAERYLEKIFQVEIPLPVPEPNEIYRVFIRDINEMSLSEDRELLGLRQFTYPDLRLLASALPNFREIRRLARLYSVELYFFKIQNVKTFDFDPKDLLWLTSIMMLDYEIYQDLYSNPNKYLLEGNSTFNHIEIYTLRPGIAQNENKLSDEEEKQKYTGQTLLRSTAIALNQMFAQKNYTSGSIKVKNNFSKYFYLGIGKYNITTQQFKEILNKDIEDIPEAINKITNRYNSNNLFTKFELYKVSEENLEALYKYYTALISWTFSSSSNLAISACSHRFVNEAFITSIDKKNKIQQFVIKTFLHSIESIDKVSLLFFIANLLKLICPITTEGDYYGYLEYGQDNILYSLLWQDEIKKLIKALSKRYFDIFTDDDASDILNGKTRLGAFYNYTSICIFSDYNDYRNDKYENVAIDIVISHFEKNKSSKIFKVKEIVGNTQDYSDPDEYDQWIEQKFSSNEKYKEYLDKCFVKEDNKE